ncbi:MAG TPA: radical SAM protein [Spirochaetota bacterium]|nr:radical SAM protein [Spirochaetota bacterium]
MISTPSYINLFSSGELRRRAELAREIITSCTLCPHECRVDRTAGGRGKCRSGEKPVVSSFHAHMGEESCLVGRNGSGTIFFTNCNLACVFCQNYDISQLGYGDEVSFERLAEMMLALQKRGCHNINLVTPTHMVYAILEALLLAVPAGLRVPLVYNSGGYDSVETLALLDGVIDIYMPDFKYADDETARNLSGARDYPERAKAALKEMHRQVGDLLIDSRGIAERGLLVRHLVLPNDLAGTGAAMRFLAWLSRDTYVNIMDQYHPEYRANEIFDLRRRATLDEYDAAVRSALDAGLHRLDDRRRRW